MDTLSQIKEKATKMFDPADLKSTQAISQILNETGGLDGLMKRFNDYGLKDVVQSWVSKEPNKSISPEQIRNVLGESLISRVSGRVGMSNDELCMKLATHLPGLVDKLSPNGIAPEGSFWSKGIAKAKELFSSKH